MFAFTGISIQRDITLLQRLASTLVLQNNLAEAADIYNELLLRNPSDPTSYAKLINIVLSTPTGDSCCYFTFLVFPSILCTYSDDGDFKCDGDIEKS